MNDHDSTRAVGRRQAVLPWRESTPAAGRPRPGAGVSWARVDETLYVASRRGTYLGYVENKYGRFHALDTRSVQIGWFPTLVAAMSALVEHVDSARPIVLRQVD